MDAYRLTPDLDNPDVEAQQTFRAVVKALDNPGHLIQIESRLSLPEVLNQASGALFLTLCNDETTVWADLNWDFSLIEWFQYQCGCSIVTEPCMANLALITKPVTMPPLDHFRIGDEDHPDTSVTLIIQVGKLFANAAKTSGAPLVTGPLVNSEPKVFPMGVPTNILDHWTQTSSPFSSSIDIFLTCDDVLTALP
jgi:alpha-D-ribose 1-methylphosphonate 5-triphosphate synthase subunit PhnH